MNIRLQMTRVKRECRRFNVLVSDGPWRHILSVLLCVTSEQTGQTCTFFCFLPYWSRIPIQLHQVSADRGPEAPSGGMWGLAYAPVVWHRSTAKQYLKWPMIITLEHLVSNITQGSNIAIMDQHDLILVQVHDVSTVRWKETEQKL